ncbi:MAG: metal ABC transporter permease [Bacteroidia bacterium]|nr:metal ABC transporter permease [Bacteroidia bacterium]
MNNPLEYAFFIKALFASILAGISSGIAGTWIVSKRKVFVTGGVSHSSFGGIGLGYFLGISPVAGAILFGVLSALGIEYMSYKTRIREDSAIGIFWSLGMALGIIFIYLTPGYAPNLTGYLFGSILIVSGTDLIALAAANAILLFFFILFYPTLLFVSYDPAYAETNKLPVRLFNYILMGFSALILVLNIRIAGIILVISILTIPPTIVNLFSHNYLKIMIYSTLISITGAVTGLFLSYFWSLPSGATIVMVFIVIFGIARIIRKIQGSG